MEKKSIYDNEFYNEQSSWSYNSAKIVMPIIIELFSPKSMADVWCWIWTWLKAWKELWIEKIKWFDWEYALNNELKIDKSEFTPIDLQTKLIADSKYDIAISLEVWEHIYDKHINTYVENLCTLSDIIIFWWAIPWQWWINHVSENWPTFWKMKFEEKWYVMLDIIRQKILNNTNIEYWYRQNMFVFIKKDLYNTKYSNLNDFLYSDELYIVHKQIIKNPCTYMHRYYNQKIINFSKKVKIYNFISYFIRLFLKKEK